VGLLGAGAVRWFYKTDCCGGGLSMSNDKLVTDLVDNILVRAREAGASALATACPLCLANLEMRRSREKELPVFYFTELMGLAFNLTGCRRWIKKHLVDPQPLLTSLGL